MKQREIEFRNIATELYFTLFDQSLQYNTIQYKNYCQLPRGGFSETNINSTGNKKTNKQKKKNTQELSINNN